MTYYIMICINMLKKQIISDSEKTVVTYYKQTIVGLDKSQFVLGSLSFWMEPC